VATLADRGKALEDEFFKKEESKLIAKRKTEKLTATNKAALKAISGMSDDEVLGKLIEIGVSADTVSALSLVPLVEVAWADGEVQDREQEAILHAAQDKGIDKGSPAHELLSGWLKSRPGESLMKAWEGYIEALDEQLTTQQLDILKHQVVDRAEAVAQAAGGFLGVKTISESEKQVLAKLEAAFEKRAEEIDDK